MRFIQGDIRDQSFLCPSDVGPNGPTPTVPASPLTDIQLDSLNSLRGRVSVIIADAFFHLFSKDDQYALARALASLLSPIPGSMIFGNHCVLREEGLWSPTPKPGESETKMTMYCHSDKSWARMWEEIFGKGKVDVRAEITELDGGFDLAGTFPENSNPLFELTWSVTRL